jgi:hypothetical protein
MCETDMYNNLGIHWASSIPAFLALMCVPFPFLFYKYGWSIRMRCKFAAEAARELQEMQDRESDSGETTEENREEEKEEEKVSGNEPERE